MSPPIERIPTSQLFKVILDNAPADHMPLIWLLSHLRRRSFGMVMLILGLMAMIPGVATLAGPLLAVLGFQMILAHESLALPRFITQRSVPTHQIMWFLRQAIPAMKVIETFIQPRWHTPFIATKRIVGFIVLMLAITLFMPIPLSNVIPGAITMLVAFAYLEEDGILLCIALSASLGSLALTILEVWGAFKGAHFLLQL